MKLIDFYNKVLKYGRAADPRHGRKVSYEDTAILHGRPDTQVKKVLVGIDIEVGEILLADRLRQKQGLDLVVAHHPEGRAWANFYEVMVLQVDLLAKAGVKRSVAEKMLLERMREVERRVLPNNHMRSVDVARILDIPFLCMHTPADNQVAKFLGDLFKKQRPKKVKDVVALLNQIPEYKDAVKNGTGPRVLAGNPNGAAGEILLEMTGGTEGPKEALAKLYKAGVRTLVSMHTSEEHFKKAKELNLNVVIAGHISSDTLGLNLLLDRIEKEEKLSIVSCSGFRRFSRN